MTFGDPMVPDVELVQVGGGTQIAALPARQVVYNRYGIAAGEQGVYEVGPDEACSPGNEGGALVRRHW